MSAHSNPLSTGPRQITVLLAEDHTIVREGLRNILGLDPMITVVAEALNGRQAVRMALEIRPMVVLMDIAMPVMNGLEASRQILKAQPSMLIIILSAHSDEAYVHHAMAAGVAGFLQKQNSAEDVCRAIRDVHAGLTVFSRGSMPAMRTADAGRTTARLTAREREVVQLIAEGRANKETAVILGISANTVARHREHLMAKLGIHDTAGLTRYAIGAGIIISDARVTTA